MQGTATLGMLFFGLLIVCSSCANPCPEDESIPGLLTDAFHENHRLLLMGSLLDGGGRDVPVETILELLGPIHATLACDDPDALRGTPGKGCYTVQLEEGMCLAAAGKYFAEVDSVSIRLETAVPYGDGCSCSPIEAYD